MNIESMLHFLDHTCELAVPACREAHEHWTEAS